MARLRLGVAGLLLLVLAAMGFELGGPAAAGIDTAWSELREAQLDPARARSEIAASSASVSADDSDDDPDRADAATQPARMRSAARLAAGGRVTARRALRPRATGPPSPTIV